MSRWSRTLTVFLAFAVMPVQGVAATLSVLYCHGDAHTHAIPEPAGHDNDTHHDGHHGTQNDEGGTGGNAANHLCCNLTVSAPPTTTLPAAVPDFPIRASIPDSFHDLFIPDRPQRPPLA